MSLAKQIINGSYSDIVKAIESGVDVNAYDEYGFRALIQAVICNKPDILELLLQAGADVEQKDFIARTALQWASDKELYHMCDILLQRGANPNHYSADGQPILVNPILREQLDLVNLLINYGANAKFAEDFISAKLLGHRFELTGETDIVNPDKQFIPISYEGFYLEFSTSLISRSLNNFINSIAGEQFGYLSGKLHKVLLALKNAATLAEIAKYKNKEQFSNTVQQILKQELLVLPSAYAGHAITFIKYKDFWTKCDRGVGQFADTVLVSYIGNIYGVNETLLYKILYQSKTEEFIKQEVTQELQLDLITTMPTKSQVTGNCSWANVEASVPAMLLMLTMADPGYVQTDQLKVIKRIYKFYNAWIEWDKDSALDEAISNFYSADDARKLSKAIIFGSILTQRCHPKKRNDIVRAKKILQILMLPEYQFLLNNYNKIYSKPNSGKIGENFMQLISLCSSNIEGQQNNKNININVQYQDLVKMTTALHIASLKGELNTVQFLIDKHKVDINYLDRTGSTALMYAAWKGHLSIVKYLCENGADIAMENHKGGTAIKYAVYSKHLDIVNYLKLAKNTKNKRS